MLFIVKIEASRLICLTLDTILKINF